MTKKTKMRISLAAMTAPDRIREVAAGRASPQAVVQEVLRAHGIPGVRLHAFPANLFPAGLVPADLAPAAQAVAEIAREVLERIPARSYIQRRRYVAG